jgi:hypothetical protein
MYEIKSGQDAAQLFNGGFEIIKRFPRREKKTILCLRPGLR